MTQGTIGKENIEEERFISMYTLGWIEFLQLGFLDSAEKLP
jgi:hypothetical protein